MRHASITLKNAVGAIDNLHDLEEPEVADEAGGDDISFPSTEPVTLLSRRSGYVQHLELDAIASALDGLSGLGGSMTFADIPFGLGFFVSAGIPIAKVWTGDSEMNGETEKRLHRGFVLGKEASFQQDFAFGLRQLSDIALLGLSLGVTTRPPRCRRWIVSRPS